MKLKGRGARIQNNNVKGIKKMREERRTGRQRKEKCAGGIARGKAQALQSHVRHCVCALSVLASDPWQRKADCFDRSTDIT